MVLVEGPFATQPPLGHAKPTPSPPIPTHESRLDADEKEGSQVHEGELAEPEKKIESLTTPIRDLAIANRAKDQILERLESERDKLFDRVAEQSRRLENLRAVSNSLREQPQPTCSRRSF